MHHQIIEASVQSTESSSKRSEKGVSTPEPRRKLPRLSVSMIKVMILLY